MAASLTAAEGQSNCSSFQTNRSTRRPSATRARPITITATAATPTTRRLDNIFIDRFRIFVRSTCIPCDSPNYSDWTVPERFHRQVGSWCSALAVVVVFVLDTVPISHYSQKSFSETRQDNRSTINERVGEINTHPPNSIIVVCHGKALLHLKGGFVCIINSVVNPIELLWRHHHEQVYLPAIMRMLLGLFKRDVKTVQLELIRSGIIFMHSRLRDYYDELLILFLWYTLCVWAFDTKSSEKKSVIYYLSGPLLRFGTMIKI